MALSTGLVHYWRMDETSGTRYDAHGNGGDVVEAGGSTPSAAGKIGNSLDIVGNTTTYLYNNSGICGNSDTFSFCCWVRLDAAVTTPYRGIFSRYQQVAISVSWYRVYMVVFTSAGTLSVTEPNPPGISTGVWSFYAFTRNHVTGNTYIYKNDLGVRDSDLGHPGTLHASAYDFEFGRYGTGNNGIDGRVDQVGYWNRELSASEVLELYNSGDGLSYGAIAGDIEITGGTTGPAATVAGTTRKVVSVPATMTGPTAAVASTFEHQPAPILQKELIGVREQEQRYFGKGDFYA